MHPFRMYGRTIQLLRYEVTYTAEEPGGDGEMTTAQVSDRFPALEEAELFAAEQSNVSIATLDTSGYEWMDGIQVPDVPDTYAEAVKIYEMGPDAYAQKLAFEARSQPDQVRADVDFIAAMQGVSL